MGGLLSFYLSIQLMNSLLQHKGLSRPVPAGGPDIDLTLSSTRFKIVYKILYKGRLKS